MRIQICNIFFILIVASCTNKVVEKPIWVNKADTVQIQESPLVFKAKTKNWQGLLQSFVQPIPLQLIHTDTGFLLKPLSKKGFIEGPSTIILKNEEQFFYYDMVISNKEVVKVMEDYRSPKTVNPDSSLEQQSIVHIIDANRNIVVEDERYFKEKYTGLVLKPIPHALLLVNP